MFVIDNRDKRPIYEQIVDKLSDLMVIGGLNTDDKLPSVRSMAMELSINPNTIQKAYLELERRGYIYSVKGIGSFVADIEAIRETKKKNIFEDLKEIVFRAKKVGINYDKFVEEVKNLYSENA
jgi:transcriptional regulator, gntR family